MLDVLNQVEYQVDEELDRPESGPKPTLSLLRRQSPLASTNHQKSLLASLSLEHVSDRADFAGALRRHGWDAFQPAPIDIFQINVGRLCNMTCRHCHVDAGPDRVRENMDLATVEACLQALDKTTAHTVDITGGAPELNPHFRYLVDSCFQRGKHIIDRCNLTILTLPKYHDLPQWLAERHVEVACSLPHFRRRNTDLQRGDGTFERSIEALRRLNEVGYGTGDPKRKLTLVTNPVGAFLSGNQSQQEKEWKASLHKQFGVSFDRLIAINNMPISRYLEWLEDSGNLQSYMETLVQSFNPGTIAGLMCRNTISVSWDGRIFDCDFNQMLDCESQYADGVVPTVFDFDVIRLQQRDIVVGRHCYGCTAGAGSSCGGSLEKEES